MVIKPWLLKLHRWLGLASGAVLVIVSLTGAILAFEPQFEPLGDQAPRPPFFQMLRHLHTRLLADEPGEWLVMGSTIALVAVLLFGIVLWWPKNVAGFKARTSLGKIFGRGVSLKRRNYDLHVVVGIVALPFLLILAMTGLMLDGDLLPSGEYRWLVRALHFGTWRGMPTQVIACVTSLLGAVFPITGFIMWWPRWNRQRKHLPIAPSDAELPSVLAD
jgi:uncharacterized iron-regulated membrane protein